ncbi:hypothetical protein CRYUN_Cryun18bG0122700 [Craigia yunnanensis]
MITIDSVTYTSLKDLLPTSPPAITSPTHNSSWHEIPIKNPLVKHAALAYLQPMSSPTEVGEKGLFGRLKERCYGECGCVLWIYDVVWRNVKEAFSERREEKRLMMIIMMMKTKLTETEMAAFFSISIYVRGGCGLTGG